MLQCENGRVKVKGGSIQVMSELSTLINVLYASKALTYDQIMEVVRVGLLSNEELKNL